MIKYEDILKARENLKGILLDTPTKYNQEFSDISQNEIYLKLENFQKTGSFKIRGACNKVASLSESAKKKGIITASAGNHAQGVALAAALRNIKAVVVMPETTPIAKITATKEYGAEVLLYGDGYDEAYKKAVEIRDRAEMTLIHAFDDPFVIAGQGTIGLEMLEDMYDLDIIVAPIGGGGLISGIGTAAKRIKPGIKLIGVETVGFDAMRQSVAAKKIMSINMANTIAEGIAVRKPGSITFQMVNTYVDDIVTVTEDEIASTILLMMEKAKFIVEGAGAAALASAIHKKLGVRDKKIGVVISGGNIDINLLSLIIHKGLVKSGRKVQIKTILKDRPGQLDALLDLLAEAKVNIISINHERDRLGVEIGFAEVDLTVETEGVEHAERLCRLMKSRGYAAEI
ncbi:MAG: threonine ammonia-lyase [Clostridia bacterium]|nr:threonine ammonia-lyase [Clostridia bacterium]